MLRDTPGSPTPPFALSRAASMAHAFTLTAGLLATTFAPPAHAQASKRSPQAAIEENGIIFPPSDVPLPASAEEIGFAADMIEYDDDSQVVTASGNVQLLREGNRLRADKVIWNRRTGEVQASGNVSVTDPDGNIAVGDEVQVTDSLKDGIVSNLLLVMQRGGRLAAAKGQRVGEIYTLDRATYSPCAVEDADGCPKTPSWQIKAAKVIYSPGRRRVSYRNARLELFGLPILMLPSFSHPVGDAGGTGFLVPDLSISGNNGVEITTPFFWKLAPNRDVTITPHIYTDAASVMEGAYRALTGRGAYQITGYGTFGSHTNSSSGLPEKDLRGYVEANGRFQLDPNWSVSGSFRRVTDRTFLRRYNISRDDRLRSMVQAERLGSDSYFSLAGWAVQGLRSSDKSGQMPIALPAIDYRLRLADPLLGGRIQLQANSLAITRTAGQDTQRAFVGAEWKLRTLTGLGQELSFTAYGRGDVYHSSDNLPISTDSYSGMTGWRTRGIVAGAVDMRWPFLGRLGSGTQRITPRVQIVAAPHLSNLAVPNEDARSIELEDSNLFALNRFPGYDRFEDSSRITYGLEYALTLPDFTINSVMGQSYRLSRRPTLFADGIGLSERLSDITGRTTARYKDFLSLTHRYRVDKDNLAIRRNEVDAAIGSRRTYATVSYLRLNRDITTSTEDLTDREEVRLGARVQIARYWSIFGSTVIDLTGKAEDSSPTSDADGYEPVRHRLGIAYQDDCLDIGLTWRRDYQAYGDARKANTFQLRLAFRNLGI